MKFFFNHFLAPPLHSANFKNFSSRKIDLLFCKIQQCIRHSKQNNLFFFLLGFCNDLNKWIWIRQIKTRQWIIRFFYELIDHVDQKRFRSEERRVGKEW